MIRSEVVHIFLARTYRIDWNIPPGLIFRGVPPRVQREISSPTTTIQCHGLIIEVGLSTDLGCVTEFPRCRSSAYCHTIPGHLLETAEKVEENMLLDFESVSLTQGTLCIVESQSSGGDPGSKWGVYITSMTLPYAVDV